MKKVYKIIEASDDRGWNVVNEDLGNVMFLQLLQS
jgi:hypothetical protein